MTLEQLKHEVESCHKCKLSATRTSVVFGEGDPHADIVIIGEGPGRQEDLQARPFIGRSGDLLTGIIEKGLGVPRSHVFIANIVKCRPTVNLAFVTDRAPDKEEVVACSPYLEKQIELIAPKAIITLGGPAAGFILQTRTGITKLRGSWGSYHNIPVMPTLHPSYLLRTGGEKSKLMSDVINDFRLVREIGGAKGR